LDNARPQNSKRSTECLRTPQIKRIPQPSYSPDIAPSNFFLFGYLKEKLTEYDIPDWERLQLAITHIFSEIGQETLITVFGTWIKPLKWVIKHKGNTSIKKQKRIEIGIRFREKRRGYELLDPLSFRFPKCIFPSQDTSVSPGSSHQFPSHADQ
jgi:hypothetical protein